MELFLQSVFCYHLNYLQVGLFFGQVGMCTLIITCWIQFYTSLNISLWAIWNRVWHMIANVLSHRMTHNAMSIFQITPTILIISLRFPWINVLKMPSLEQQHQHQCKYRTLTVTHWRRILEVGSRVLSSYKASRWPQCRPNLRTSVLE